MRKTASFFECFSLCLPRACLGKIIVLIYKWLKNAVFFADLSGSWDEGTVAQTLFYFEMPFIYTFIRDVYQDRLRTNIGKVEK